MEVVKESRRKCKNGERKLSKKVVNGLQFNKNGTSFNFEKEMKIENNIC